MKVEVEKFDDAMEIDDADDEKEEETLKLKERELQWQQVVAEQSKLLREKENQEIQTKKKAARHLQKALSSGNEDKPAITTDNIYQQILEAKKTNEQISHPLLQQQSKQEENMEWMKNKLAINPQSAITSSIECLAKKIQRLNWSSAMSTEHIVKVIQCGM